MTLTQQPLVIKQDGIQAEFCIDYLYSSIHKAIRVTRGFDRPGEMIAKFITKQVINKLPEQETLETQLIIKTIIHISTINSFNEIADYFFQYLHN